MTLLQQINEAIRDREVESFQRIVDRACVDLGMSSRDLALVVSATVTTVDRWRLGLGAPHEISRESVLMILKRRARRALHDKASVER